MSLKTLAPLNNRQSNLLIKVIRIVVRTIQTMELSRRSRNGTHLIQMIIRNSEEWSCKSKLQSKIICLGLDYLAVSLITWDQSIKTFLRDQLIWVIFQILREIRMLLICTSTIQISRFKTHLSMLLSLVKIRTKTWRNLVFQVIQVSLNQTKTSKVCQKVMFTTTRKFR